jgi:hypothetical protein
VEIHVPLTPLIGLPEGEDPFPWIDEVMDYIAELDERGEAALYDDGGEFGDVYVFLINAASEERLLAVAARIADLPGVPAGLRDGDRRRGRGVRAGAPGRPVVGVNAD